jgi:hypothetical protein
MRGHEGSTFTVLLRGACARTRQPGPPSSNALSKSVKIFHVLATLWSTAFAVFMEGYACCQSSQLEMHKIWQQTGLCCQKSSSNSSVVESNKLKDSYSSVSNAAVYGLGRSSLSGRGRNVSIRQNFQHSFRDRSPPFAVCIEYKTAEAWVCTLQIKNAVSRQVRNAPLGVPPIWHKKFWRLIMNSVTQKLPCILISDAP